MDIVLVDELTWMSGLDYFVTALDRLKRGGLRFRACILGSGPLLNQMWYSVEALDLAPNVRITCNLTPKMLEQELLRADIFVSCSHSVTMPQLVLGMQASLPILTTATGCAPAVIRNGVEGILVQDRNISELAAGLRYLAAYADLRTAMGMASQHRLHALVPICQQLKINTECQTSLTQ